MSGTANEPYEDCAGFVEWHDGGLGTTWRHEAAGEAEMWLSLAGAIDVALGLGEDYATPLSQSPFSWWFP
jgi:hypothetical protein